MLDLVGSIVLYKTDRDVLKEIIGSFVASGLNTRLYLIDNSPTDALKDITGDPRVVYIYNNANLGYGRGHNIAIRRELTNSPYHVVLNPDIVFDGDIFGRIMAYMNGHEDIGQLMPKVYYPDGRLQYLCKLIPTPVDLIFKRFLPGEWLKRQSDRFQLKFTGYDQIMNVPYLSGCFMFLRTKALQDCGLFDERFFMYPEDIDLTRRIHRKYKTVFYPDVSIVHQHGAGSYKDMRLLYIHIRNMIKYFNKWGWIFDKERRTVNKNVLKTLEYNEQY